MSKIDPKSEMFAGGQLMNQPKGLPGKALAKNEVLCVWVLGTVGCHKQT